MDRPVGAVGGEGAGQPMAGEHDPQDRYDRGGTFPALHELRIQDLLRRIVHDDEQGVPGFREEGRPAVPAAIEVQQLPETGTGLAAPAAPGPALADQAGGLPGSLEQRVGEGHTMIPAGELMEVAHIESVIPLPIEAEDPLEFGKRYPPRRGGLAAPIEQPRHPIVQAAPASGGRSGGSGR